jgi:hypothetical protein
MVGEAWKMGVLRSQLAVGDVQLKDARCTVTLGVPAPNVVYTVFDGYVDGELCAKMLDDLGRLCAPLPRVVLFTDAELLVGYTPEVRPLASEWMKSLGSKLVNDHILVRSKVVAMGVAVANLAVGGILRAYSSRSDFNAAARLAGVPVARVRAVP